MSADNERDGAGRHPGAPAWDGRLAALSPSALELHDKGLMAHIANLTVRYGVLSTPSWRARTPDERRKDDFDRWVARLVATRNERDRRERLVGGVNAYLDLLTSPAAEQPWDDQAMRPTVTTQ